MKKRNLSWKDFEYGIERLVEDIKKSKMDINSVHGIPTGGLIIAATLSKRLKLRYKYYPENINNNTLICDDVNSKLYAIKFYSSYFKICPYATLFIEKGHHKPDFYAYTKRKNEYIRFPWQ